MTIPGSGTLIWKDDGTTQQALFSTASLVHGPTIDYLQIVGGTSGSIGIAFGIAQAPPVMAGTFQCGPNGTGPIVSFAYTAPNVAPAAQTCTIVLTTLGAPGGAHATGTFSATVPLTTSGSKAITNGTFDIPLTAAN